MTHLVNCLQFEIQCPDEDMALNVRHNFSQTYHEQIAEVIDRVCSKYVSEEESIRIDKLEIDLGHFSSNFFASEFAHVFLIKFEKELTEKLSEIPSGQREASRQFSELELVQFFLQHGTLPWWADESKLDVDELTHRVIVTQQESLRQFFYNHRFNPALWRRVVLQLNNETKTLILLLFEEFIKAKSLLTLWIAQLSDRGVDPGICESIQQNNAIQNILLNNASLLFRHSGNNRVVLNIFKNYVAEFVLGNAAAMSTINDALSNMESNISLGGSGTALSPEEIETAHQDETLHDDLADKEELKKYVVRHAGIIVLAPFLKPFFSELNLLDGSEWKNNDAQYKAIHLLKFLATGQQKVPEYNLTLEKLLCGLAIEFPIPLDVVLGENEIKEAEVLLASVIGHWQALKNTSINGFRETFLKRDGIITRTEKGWLLQVERKTLDVLLDSIPWGYSTISVTWNSSIIFTEW